MALSRAEMRQIVFQSPNAAFLEEVAHQMGVDREYEYDEIAAAFDAEDRAETWLAEGHKGARGLLVAARQVLIAIGFYRPMAAGEIANTFTSNGRPPWVFKMAGIAYTSDDSAEAWMFPVPFGDGQADTA